MEKLRVLSLVRAHWLPTGTWVVRPARTNSKYEVNPPSARDLFPILLKPCQLSVNFVLSVECIVILCTCHGENPMNGTPCRDTKGVRWMIYNWLQGRGSVLADEMGLGKTLQVSITCAHT